MLNTRNRRSTEKTAAGGGRPVGQGGEGADSGQAEIQGEKLEMTRIETRTDGERSCSAAGRTSRHEQDMKVCCELSHVQAIARRCVETAEELQKLVMRDMADNVSRKEQSQELQGYEAIARTQRGPNRPKTQFEKAKFPSLRRTFVCAQFSGRELAGAETLFRCARESERESHTAGADRSTDLSMYGSMTRTPAITFVDCLG